jgi:hypothetical protein
MGQLLTANGKICMPFLEWPSSRILNTSCIGNENFVFKILDDGHSRKGIQIFPFAVSNCPISRQLEDSKRHQMIHGCVTEIGKRSLKYVPLSDQGKPLSALSDSSQLSSLQHAAPIPQSSSN